MSDIKRAVLTTLEPQKVSDKVVKKPCKTVRIRVPLPESNEDKCPEYSYKDELAAVKKKSKQNGSKETTNASVPNGLDPFGDENDDDVRRIALEMEAKYGSGVSDGPKKKRKGRKDDYADIGAGYDESDSFIDNTDGYDEIIPHNVTTARGGFYINSGALEFKTDDEVTSEVSSSSSDDSSDSEEEVEGSPNKSKRKRALDTSDEEEGNNSNQSSQDQKKQNGEKPNISMHQAIKKKLFSTDKIQIKKRKLADQQKNTVKELLKEKRMDTNSADEGKNVCKENKKPMKMSSIDDAIDSVIARVEDLPNKKSPDKIETKVDEAQIVDHNKNGDVSPPSADPSNQPQTSDTTKSEFVKLPENLPADILELIEKLKSAAKDYKDGGKVKFFSGEVNVMLLNLERKCKVLGRSSRVRVYEHLAPYVRCRKETLIKRAKNLVIEEEERKLQRTIVNLKSKIDRLMPALITNHENECQKVLQKKFSQEAAVNEDLKNLKAPRRRFTMNEEMKKMMRDIVNFKKRCLLHEGKPKDSLEDLLNEYLKREILVLWPEGWMSMTVVKKFCTTMAIKTPDPKAAVNAMKHSQKLPASSTIINYSSGNNLTITPVNLADKLSEVSNNNVNSSKPDTIIKPLKVETVLETVVKPVVKPEKKIKPLHKEKSDVLEPKDNGVIVLSSKIKQPEPVIPKDMHCQIIDLTDTPVKKSVIEDTSHALKLPSREFSTKPDIEAALKTKFPSLSVTPANTHNPNDRDDVLKVMESLKALQQLSSPSKSDVSNPAVSVIAFNKNYSNSNSNHSGVNNEATNLTGTIGFQDEYQNQFISSLNHKSSSSATPTNKPKFNSCS